MVIYRPKEEQRYYYYGVDQTEVYWVHFTGNNVTNILRQHGISDDMHIIYTGTSLEYKRIFTSIINELRFCKSEYEELCVYYLMELLILTHRLSSEKPRKSNLLTMQEMEQAVQYFSQNYNSPINIDEYAHSHNFSISWFIQSFKQYTGTTPTQYLLFLRISNAKIYWKILLLIYRKFLERSDMKTHYILAVFSRNKAGFPRLNIEKNIK